MRGEDHEHEEHGEREHEVAGGAREILLVGELGPLHGEAGRELFLQQPGDRRLGLAGAVAGGGHAGDVGGRVAVVTHDAVGSVGLAHLDEGGERDHVAGGVAGAEQADVGGLVAEGRVGLDDDLVGAAEAVEIVHVDRAEVGLHGLEERCEIDALGLGLGAVHVGEELRHVDGVAGEKTGELGALRGLRDQLLGGGEEGVGAEAGAVLDVELEAAGGAEAVDRRGREDGDKGVLDAAEFLLELRGDGGARLVVAFALLEGF